jgi:peptide/nickel transport system permease protein
MASFILRRFLLSLLILFFVTLITFFTVRLSLNDIELLGLNNVIPEGPTKEQWETIRSEYHLNEPLIVQYARFMGDALRGNLGNSVYFQKKVSKLLGESLPFTLSLCLTVLLVSYIVGVSAGLLSVFRLKTRFKPHFNAAVNLVTAVPVFWLGMILYYLITVRLGWGPVVYKGVSIIYFWRHYEILVLPVVTIAIPIIFIIARQTYSGALGIMQQGYIRTARAKGLTEGKIFIRHFLKNSLLHEIQNAGMIFGLILGASVWIENVFNIQGIGRLWIESVATQDYFVLQGIVLTFAFIFIVFQLIVDIGHAWLDPRIRSGQMKEPLSGTMVEVKVREQSY